MTDPAISGSNRVPQRSLSQPQSAKKVDWRLHKHADYQRVYRTGRRQSLPLLTYFFSIQQERPAAPVEAAPAKAALPAEIPGPRIGLTTGRVLGKAVERNRIKRRMREAVRRNLGLLTGPVDVVLHPRRSVLDAEFSNIEREMARAFQFVQRAITRPATEVAKQQVVAGQDRDANAGAAGK